MSTEDERCRRKEQRYKTGEDRKLKCKVFVDVNDPVDGHVIDISPNGLRLFCEGEFRSGDAFLTELNTDILHGVFPGIIRRVSPWIGGGSVLGCQLLETIPEEVLESLAKQHIVNRRREDRVKWNQPALMSWELGPKEVPVTIKDCSVGGLRLHTAEPVPDDTRVRLLLPGNETNPIVIEAKTVWETEIEGGWELGLAFIRRELPESVAQVLTTSKTEEMNVQDQSATTSSDQSNFRGGVLAAAAAATFAIAMLLFAIR